MELSRKQEYRNQKYSIGVTLLSFVVMVIFFIFTNVITANSPSTPLALREVAFQPDNGNPNTPETSGQMAALSSSKHEEGSGKESNSATEADLKSPVQDITQTYRSAHPKTTGEDYSETKMDAPVSSPGLTGNETANKPGVTPSWGYELAQRTLVLKPNLVHGTKEEGKVVVEITVDKNGVVTEADPNGRGTTTNSSHLKNEARKMTLATKFSENQKLEEQRGTITIIFSFD